MENLTLNTEICKHQNCLEAFALKFTGNTEDAGDLVQDTVIKAIRYHAMYKEGTNLRGWLYTIMRNTFINDYRRGSRRRAVIETSEDLSSFQLYHSAGCTRIRPLPAFTKSKMPERRAGSFIGWLFER